MTRVNIKHIHIQAKVKTIVKVYKHNIEYRYALYRYEIQLGRALICLYIFHHLVGVCCCDLLL